MGGLVYLQDVVTLQFDQERCVGCGMCTTVCPHGVFGMNKQGPAYILDRDSCMECGACSKNCPASAISVKTGVGCAQAVINTMLGRKGGSCSCVIEPDGQIAEHPDGNPGRGSGYCC